MTDNFSFENRIFKLSNGEKVNPHSIEKLISDACHYVKYVVVSGEGNDNPVALIFPNTKYFSNPEYKIVPEEGCFCPRDLNELGKCLTGCMKTVNLKIDNGLTKLSSATIINNEINDEKHEDIIEKYKSFLHQKFGNNIPNDEEIYIIKIDKNNF